MIFLFYTTKKKVLIEEWAASCIKLAHGLWTTYSIEYDIKQLFNLILREETRKTPKGIYVTKQFKGKESESTQVPRATGKSRLATPRGTPTRQALLGRQAPHQAYSPWKLEGGTTPS